MFKKKAKDKKPRRLKKQEAAAQTPPQASAAADLSPSKTADLSAPEQSGQPEQKKLLEIPTVAQLEAELGRETYRWKFRRVLRSTIYALITVAAAAVLVAMLWMPVLQISGNSMTPTLTDGQIVVSVKGSSFQPGDIVAFYYENKILVKRVIATSGDWVDIDAQGTVFINGEELYEPYLMEKAFGECNITLPYQVPENRLFVMGDHRSVSVDSRNSALGCVSDDQLVGKLLFRVWPYNVIGLL